MSYHIESVGAISLHHIGNKSAEEGCIISEKCLNIDEETAQTLKNYFINHFKGDERYCLAHQSDLSYNEVYGFVSAIFDDPSSLHDMSINLARHLYEQSTHPKIKAGEFYTVYFSEAIIDGEVTDAVGLFKSENKDTFLRVTASTEGMSVKSLQGVNINKLDKGCLIFNLERENGYILAIVDNTNKGSEALYWVDDFLKVRPLKDDYHDTQNILSLCRDFVTDRLPEQFEVTKADQAEMLNRSLAYFKQNDNFDLGTFSEQVIAQPEVVESFMQYKDEYAKERDIEVNESFTISDNAVKRESRSFKSVIKLDRNFHIYIHGDNKYLKRGFDPETGMNYYQLFFKEEE